MRADGPRATWTGQPYHVSTTVGPDASARTARVSRRAMALGVGAAALAGLVVGIVARPGSADRTVPPATQAMPVELATAAPAAAPLAGPAPAGGQKLDVRPTVVAPAAAPSAPALAVRAPSETSPMTYTVTSPALPARPPRIEREPTVIDPGDAPPDEDGPPPDEPN